MIYIKCCKTLPSVGYFVRISFFDSKCRPKSSIIWYRMTNTTPEYHYIRRKLFNMALHSKLRYVLEHFSICIPVQHCNRIVSIKIFTHVFRLWSRRLETSVKLSIINSLSWFIRIVMNHDRLDISTFRENGRKIIW